MRMSSDDSRFFACAARMAVGTALSACLLLATAPGVSAAGAEASLPGCEGVSLADTIASVQVRYDGIQDLEARFSQTTRSIMMGGGGLGDETPTTGRVQIAKPGRMRWHYESPRESLVMSDGVTLWIYDVPAKEVTRARVTEGYLAGAALQFLLGEGAIADSYEVELLACAGEVVTLELLPKQDAAYEKLEISVGPGGVVVGTTIHDLFGNVTALRFEDVEFDRSPDIARFRYAPVEGVKLNDLTSDSGG